jgi:hypothetical protein
MWIAALLAVAQVCACVRRRCAWSPASILLFSLLCVERAVPDLPLCRRAPSAFECFVFQRGEGARV